ncbi:fibroblast growth factor 19-like isoform X2 [Brachyhypopomus gauderio]
MGLGDQVRQRHLYTEIKHRSLFLEIFPNGTITGTPRQTAHTLMELKAVKPGETAIWGMESARYLCIGASGQLFALSVFLNADCSFSELLESDGYTYFLSTHHKRPLSLNFKGLPQKHILPYSQFLPLRNNLFLETKVEEEDNTEHLQTEEDLDSDDPLRLSQSVQNPRSPLFHMDQ